MQKQVKKFLSQFAAYRFSRTRLKFLHMSRVYQESYATRPFPVPHQSMCISLRSINCTGMRTRQFWYLGHYLFNTSVATDPDNGDVILLHRVSNSVAPSYVKSANLQNYQLLQRGRSLAKAREALYEPISFLNARFDPLRVEDIRLFGGGAGRLLGIGFLSMADGGRPILVSFDSASGWRQAHGRVLDSRVGVSTANAIEKNWSVLDVSRERLLLLTDAGAGSLFELPLDEGMPGSYLGVASPRFSEGNPRVPSRPIRFTVAGEYYLVALGHYQYRTTDGVRGYETRMFFMRAAQPEKILCSSAPIYFKIRPLGFIYPFQMTKVGSGINQQIVISLNDSDRRTILVSLEWKQFFAWCCEVLKENLHSRGDPQFQRN